MKLHLPDVSDLLFTASDPEDVVTAGVTGLRPGQHLVVIGPPSWPLLEGYGALVAAKAEYLESVIAGDSRLEFSLRFNPPTTRDPLAATVFIRR